MKRTLLLLLSIVSLSAWGQVIYADYSDPDVCQDQQGDYWMTASSFQCTPGLPLLHSTDGSRWELVGHALPRLIPTEHYDSIQHGCGVWAPSIRHHDGMFYIYWGDPDYGIYMTRTRDPRGTWETPVLVIPGRGLIDPCPLWDEDGRCYLVHGWAASRCGFNSVLTLCELTPDGTQAIGTPRLVYDGQQEGNHTVEGPKLYRHGGYYYILAPAGGVEKGWQLALRSKNIWGPYESKIVFQSEGIHQGGLVGNHFFAFQDRGAYGRVVHRLDVQWKHDWPMMSLSPKHDKTLPVTGTDQYQWHANYQSTFGFPTPAGTRVYGHQVGNTYRNLWQVPNLYLRKFEGETFTTDLPLVITANGAGQQSGVVIMGRDYCRLAVELLEDNFVLRQVICHDADQGGREESTLIADIPARRYNAGALDNYECHITFRIQCQQGALCTLSYSLDGQHFTPLPQTFQARVGKWIGAKYGVYSITTQKSRGWVDLMMQKTQKR